MDRIKLKGVLREIGIDAGRHGEFKDSGDNIQFCCPFHGETRPSCGINVYSLVGSCFACEEGFNLAKLVAFQLDFTYPNGDVDISRGYKWLEEKFGAEFKIPDHIEGIRRIEDDEDISYDINTRYETPKVFIAPFMSGKSTHSYFFDRGFSKETVKEFMIGWDADRMRITIPVFWGDGKLCGVIGRAVLENKIDGERNPKFYKHYKSEGNNDVKYYIYDKFPVGDTLFPIPQFKNDDGLAILVEGQFDAMWCHQLGHPEVLSTLGSKLAYNKRLHLSKQVHLLREMGVSKVLLLRDDDGAGHKGSKRDYKILKDEGFTVFETHYPEGKTDPQQLTKEELDNMIEQKTLYGFKKFKRNIRRIE